VTEKKRSLNTTNVLAAIAIIALFALSVFVGVYIQQNGTLQDKNSQISSLEGQLSQSAADNSPKLVSINFQYIDNRSDTNAPFLQITGYVVNVGDAKANNCTIQVNAEQNGNVTALKTSASIPSLDPGAYEAIDVQFPYTGQALMVYTSTLTWTN
jgi:hypothetical protein